MRHSSIQLTMDIYGHLFDRDKKQAANLMGNFVQRRAQRKGGENGTQMGEMKWSHGESNPSDN